MDFQDFPCIINFHLTILCVPCWALYSHHCSKPTPFQLQLEGLKGQARLETREHQAI